jgi:hypothetical protein
MIRWKFVTGWPTLEMWCISDIADTNEKAQCNVGMKMSVLKFLYIFKLKRAD